MSLSIYQKGLLLVLVPFLANVLWTGFFWQSLNRASHWLETAVLEANEILLTSKSVALFDRLTIYACEWVKSSGDKSFALKFEEDGMALLHTLEALKNATSSKTDIGGITENLSREIASFEGEVRVMEAEKNPLEIDYVKRLPSQRFMSLMKETENLMRMMNANHERFNTTLELEERDRNRTKLITGAGLVLNLLIAALLAFLLQRGIAHRISSIVKMAQQLTSPEYDRQKTVGHDELAELERELLAARQQLLEAYRYRREFMALVAGKMQQPLKSCIEASLMLEQEPGMREAKCQKHLRSLRASATSCLGLIEDMLLLDSLDRGSLPVEMQPLKLRAVVSASVALVDTLALNKRITVENQVDDLSVTADQGRIKQVLINLLSNAIKFSPADSIVTIKSAKQGGRVRISVIDSGPGIEKQARARLFQKFYQTTEGKAAGGTGLGLAIAQLIVEAHHGLIGVDSTPGKGSTFWFEIPS